MTGLPAYLFVYGDKSLIAGGVLNYADLITVFHKLTDGKLVAAPPAATSDSVRDLTDRHPLISPMEIREAFDLRDIAEVQVLIRPLFDAGKICVRTCTAGGL